MRILGVSLVAYMRLKKCTRYGLIDKLPKNESNESRNNYKYFIKDDREILTLIAKPSATTKTWRFIR